MIAEAAKKLRENIQKVIVGKDEVINLTLVAGLFEGYLLLEDVPGIGKTTLARALVALLGVTFPLPEAQIDRFLLRVSIGYPSQEEENPILERLEVEEVEVAWESVKKAGENFRSKKI